MKMTVRSCTILLVLIAALPAFSDDQSKANKELTKVAAIAWDASARAVVSHAVADVTGVKRAELVQQRQAMNVNYASVFVVEELMKSGAKLEDITAQVKAGKTVTQVADDQHANWKQIAADAKNLNSKIDDSLYKHFLNDKADKQRDLDEKYDITADTVAADHDVPKPDLEAAAERYNLWKGRAAAAGGNRHELDTATQQAAYSDHARAGGPGGTPGGTAGAGGDGGVGTPAPAAGGARTGPN
jgi:hypothetical protein